MKELRRNRGGGVSGWYSTMIVMLKTFQTVKTLTEDQTMESFETLMTVENLPKPSNEKK